MSHWYKRLDLNKAMKLTVMILADKMLNDKKKGSNLITKGLESTRTVSELWVLEIMLMSQSMRQEGKKKTY